MSRSPRLPLSGSQDGVWRETDMRPKRFRVRSRRSGEFFGILPLRGQFGTPLTIEEDQAERRGRRLLTIGLALSILWLLLMFWH
ncbi:MAG: hypothetical protein ACI4QD_04865 [Kiritimatiellia bacterium]